RFDRNAAAGAVGRSSQVYAISVQGHPLEERRFTEDDAHLRGGAVGGEGDGRVLEELHVPAGAARHAEGVGGGQGEGGRVIDEGGVGAFARDGGVSERSAVETDAARCVDQPVEVNERAAWSAAHHLRGDGEAVEDRFGAVLDAGRGGRDGLTVSLHRVVGVDRQGVRGVGRDR